MMGWIAWPTVSWLSGASAHPEARAPVAATMAATQGIFDVLRKDLDTITQDVEQRTFHV
jgi:hypothetical protein